MVTIHRVYTGFRTLLGRVQGDPALQPDASSAGPSAFIVACPRSGTTWLKQALSSHPHVLCVERRLFGMYWDSVQDAGAVRARLRITADQYIDCLASVMHGGELSTSVAYVSGAVLTQFVSILDQFLRRVSGRQILVDKLTPYAGTAEAVVAGIRRCCPEAPIIALVRDGRDVATSGVFHWLSKSADKELDAVGLRRRAFFLNHEPGARLDRFFSDQDLSEWADMWTTALAVIESLRPHHRVLSVRYEDMIRDFPRVLSEIFAFLGAAQGAEITARAMHTASFESMSGGRKPGQEVCTAHVRKGVVGDWRNYFTRRDGETFNRLAGPQLLRLGYETDPQWAASLPDALQLEQDQKR